MSEGRSPLAKHLVIPLARAKPWTSGSQNPELNVNVFSFFLYFTWSFFLREQGARSALLDHLLYLWEVYH